MWPVRTPPGEKPPAGSGPNASVHLRAHRGGVGGQPAGAGPLPARLGLVDLAAERGLAVAGEGGGQGAGLRLVLGVGVPSAERCTSWAATAIGQPV